MYGLLQCGRLRNSKRRGHLICRIRENLCCFTDRATEQVLHDFVGIEPRNFAYKPIRKMRVGQDAIAVKLHITPSETQPEVEASDGVTAKKIQNVYVYCQYITRTS